MINRTYVVNVPGSQRVQAPYIDICVRATMGTRLLPVADPVTYGAANVTAPPAGWVAACGGAAYYEIRGRTLRLEHLFGEGAAAGYVQRTNLNFDLTVTPYGDHRLGGAGAALGGAQLSQSLLEHVGGDVGTAIPATDLADPVYGVAQPVIRVHVPQIENLATDTGLLLVSLNIFEMGDDDVHKVKGS
jgi:hypothetical protein